MEIENRNSLNDLEESGGVLGECLDERHLGEWVQEMIDGGWTSDQIKTALNINYENKKKKRKEGRRSRTMEI